MVRLSSSAKARGVSTAMRPPNLQSAREVAVLLAALIVDVVAFSSLFGGREQVAGPARTLIPIYAAAGIVLLVWRRRWPIPVFCAVLAHALLARLILPGYHPTVGSLVALHAVAASTSLFVSLLALAATAPVFGFAVSYAGTVESDPEFRTEAQLLSALGYLVLGAGALSLGRRTGRSRRRVELLEDQHRLDRQAVADERLRIARELHDIVSNTLAIISLHAGGAARNLDRDPEVVRQALATIEESGRRANTELHQLLGLLRFNPLEQDSEASGDGATIDGLKPIPRLAEVNHVVAQVRTGGVQVDVQETGRRRPLTSVVDLAAYRTIQEALTNVSKHAGHDSTAHVDICWGDDLLTLQVRDKGGTGTAPASTSGHGLLGLRERIEIADGQFDAGPIADGFHVTVRLPYNDIRDQPSGALLGSDGGGASEATYR